MVSSNAGSTFADIAATGVAWWLQVYVEEDRRVCVRRLEAAVTAGARAVVLTADTPVVGTRYRRGEAARVWELADPSWVGANRATTSGLEPIDRARRWTWGLGKSTGCGR